MAVTHVTGQPVLTVRARTVDIGGSDTSDTAAFMIGCSYYSEAAEAPPSVPAIRLIAARSKGLS
jgi:hypothetical protein